VTTDLQALFQNKIKDHILALFQTEFSPQVFAIEQHRLSYDETTKRVSVTLSFIYQKEGGEDVVEVAQSVAFREARTIDYTPIHDDNEFAAEADVGFATLERISSRTVIVLGEETPKRRLAVKPKEGPAGRLDTVEAGAGVSQTGWNITQNTSQVTPSYIGDPDEDQIRVTTLTETVVERYHEAPAVRPATTFRT